VSSRPLPDTGDELLAGFWEHTRRRVLCVQRCDGCGRTRWPPRYRCAVCGSFAAGWQPVIPVGRLFSWTVSHRALHPGFAGRLPYIVGLVEIDEPTGVRFLGNVVGIEPCRLVAGMRMAVRFEDVDERVTLVHWQPADGDTGT
jgi:uncharacterized OB-fold protein